MQFLAYDPHWNPETPLPTPSPEFFAEMGKFMTEAIQAGVIVTTGSLQPKGTRLKLTDGKFSVTDGPFIELKELTGGFAVIRADSLEEAIEWCKRFLTIIGGNGESEIVQLFGPEDLGTA